MDKRRAKEIAASPVMANVTYNGAQIYIENVNEKDGLANIHPLDQPSHGQRVPVASLTEH